MYFTQKQIDPLPAPPTRRPALFLRCRQRRLSRRHPNSPGLPASPPLSSATPPLPFNTVSRKRRSAPHHDVSCRSWSCWWLHHPPVQKQASPLLVLSYCRTSSILLQVRCPDPAVQTSSSSCSSRQQFLLRKAVGSGQVAALLALRVFR